MSSTRTSEIVEVGYSLPRFFHGVMGTATR